MPKQQKRRHRQRDETRRDAARHAPEAGHWEAFFETRDESELREHIRRLQASAPQIDWGDVRIDRLCGRLRQPTTYRLSRFMHDPAPDPGSDLPSGSDVGDQPSWRRAADEDH